jgi:hypothetical protein
MVIRPQRAAVEAEAERNASLAWQEAEEQLLADMDQYQNWLAMHCTGVKPEHTRIGYVPRDAVDLQNAIDTFDVPQLLAMTLYPGRDAQAMALDRLRELYLEQNTRHLRDLAETALVGIEA